MLAALAAAAAIVALQADAPATRTAAGQAIAEPAAPACVEQRFEDARFTVCKFDARVDTLRITYRDASGRPLRRLAALERAIGPDAAAVRFAVNAGMFDEQGAPIGLFVEDGREVRAINLKQGSGNFHLMPNGVFAQDKAGRVHVVPSRSFAKRVPDPRWATQSGPMLVIDGKLHPKFDADGESRLFRNGVGVSDDRTAWFAISEGGVSFGKFARLFRDALGCPDALFLDGSVSSLWHPAEGRQDDVAELGPMIVVTRPGAAAQR